MSCDKDKPLRDDVGICEECNERHRELSRIDYESEGGKLLKKYMEMIRLRPQPVMRCAVLRVSQEEYDLMFEATPATIRYAPSALLEAGFPGLFIYHNTAITVAHREGVDPPEYWRDYKGFLRAMEVN